MQQWILEWRQLPIGGSLNEQAANFRILEDTLRCLLDPEKEHWFWLVAPEKEHWRWIVDSGKSITV